VRQQNRRAGFHGRNARTDLLDDPDALDAGHTGKCGTNGIFAFEHIDIRRIDRRKLHPNACFAGPGRWQFDFVETSDASRLTVLLDHYGADFLAHGPTLPQMPEPAKPAATIRHYHSGARLALVGIMVNAVLGIAKIMAGLLGNTYALIADGVESLLDIFASLVVWFGLRVAAEPPDDEHPYGHGKAEVLASVVVALTVLAAAVGLAVQSIREIRTPHQMPAPWTLAVLVVVVIVKEYLARKVARAGEQMGSTAVKSDAWHHRADAITSALAFVGILIALWTKYPAADDWAALIASAVIAWNGLILLRPAMREAMDTAPPKTLEDEVRTIAQGVSGVRALDQCRIRKMGLDFYVDLHVGVDPALSVREGHRIAHAVRKAVRDAKAEIADVLVHIEPEDELDDGEE
jgi:cation diffusion facilitator family transporter